MTDRSDNFMSGWKLNPKQAVNVIERGSVMEHATEPRRPLAPYVAMAELFVSERIDALEFESRFRSEFCGLQDIYDKDFVALNELFYVVEDFVADVTERDPGDVTEAELLAGARAFLNACRGVMKATAV